MDTSVRRSRCVPSARPAGRAALQCPQGARCVSLGPGAEFRNGRPGRSGCVASSGAELNNRQAGGGSALRTWTPASGGATPRREVNNVLYGCPLPAPRRDILREGGYFGPWQTCKELQYNREICGKDVSRFHPVDAVYFAGVVAAIGVASLGVFCVMSVLQMAMVASKDQICMPYSALVIAKLALALLATLLAIAAAGLFALQTDRKDSFRVTRGESFYIQIVTIVLDFALFVLALYDMIFTRRAGGDPTMTNQDPRGDAATTFNNPGFRESRNRAPISMTDASGKPYSQSPPIASNGSVQSVTTTSSNGSTIGSGPRSPLRSSLKKPRPNQDGMGIQNPGFSGHSPTFSRNGSVKKTVRIQTHSTAV
ncbi:uncharacterized protein LOC126474607 [Schistocerca serialis cubense]|uniref:uncharacterized protein LOC126474607 n=1 Tax=Schistocerca serialis cubense TaxID=2023355 RepID=UPI00214E8F44|nr:uncharacterized protein LOC126474607 [Schistocerca serialis cubense]